MINRITLSIVIWATFLASCQRTVDSDNSLEEEALFQKISSDSTGISFSNDLVFDKEFNIFTYRNFYNGGGVAIGDINNDGLVDIYFTSNLKKNVLYLNQGGLKFKDITFAAGVAGTRAWSTGVSMADVNADGYLDIYVCNSGDIEGDNKQNELFINNGDLTFTESAKEYGLDDRGFSTHAAFFDYDKDGDLDAYLLNNSYQAIGSFNLMTNKRPKRDSVGGDKFFKNENGKFIDISEEANIYGSVIGFGLGVTVGDINMDGWQDIFVSNDFFERDYLYINQQDGTFKESLTEQMNSISAASMGADLADINNDLYPDIFVTDMLPEPLDRLKQVTTFENWDKINYNVNNGYYWQYNRNMLHLNNGNGTFSEVARLSGVAATDWSWGALFFDMDNDGYKDIFVANGINQDITDLDYLNFISSDETKKKIISETGVDYKGLIDPIPYSKVPNYAFRNKGGVDFENVSKSWGLGDSINSNGSAFGDLDNDGDLDLVVSNVNSRAAIYKNTASEIGNHNFTKLILKGDKGNSHAFGAKIFITTAAGKQYYEQMPIRGFQSSVDSRINIGVGNNKVIDSLVVIWPNGQETVLIDVEVNQIIELHIGDAEKGASTTTKPIEKEIFTKLLGNPFDYEHKENSFVDFDRDRLTYHMNSTVGPKMAKADVNGDGLEDIFIGGAKGFAGELFVQSSNGNFSKSDQEVFKADLNSEDTSIVFFDADGDSDQDIFVASGGNEFGQFDGNLRDRLYLNDGSGNFTKSENALLTKNKFATGTAAAGDFDKDGDIDLFVGVRLIPFLYGVAPDSFLYVNDGKGNFTVDQNSIDTFKEFGMVTNAAWSDIDADGDLDLVCVGEYMPITIIENKEGVLAKSNSYSALSDKNGWWNTMWLGDIDSDGDIDIIAGNHGLNSRFKASAEKPLKLYVNDFDANGTAEQILTTTIEGEIYPFTLKHDLVTQLPSLKKDYLKYQSYNSEKMGDIFSEEILQSSKVYEANFLSTTLFLNNGISDFEVVELPTESQFAPVFAIDVFDYNSDGKLDILLGGNFFEAKPEAGRYDASYGTFLTLSPQGQWQSVPSIRTGLREKGQIRSFIRLEQERLLLIGKNKDAISTLSF